LFYRKCSIGRACQFTQTKTEQKWATSGLFFRLRVSILIAPKIWDYTWNILSLVDPAKMLASSGVLQAGDTGLSSLPAANAEIMGSA
jgi:hypothetical protein